MADIIKLKRRIARKKREAERDKGFTVRDCRDSFFVIDDEYLNGYARVCGPTVSMVYIALCRHVGKEQVCYPSSEHLARVLGVTKVTVLKAIGELERRGLIQVDRKKGEPSIYTLTNKRNWRKGVPVVTEEEVETVKHLGEVVRQYKEMEEEDKWIGFGSKKRGG